MRFTVQRDALAEAVTWVARALPTRPVVPVLAGLLLRAEREDQNQPGSNGPGWLTASCFDYEVSARMRVRAEVAEPGVFLVPGRLLVEIVRSLPAQPVEFGDDPDGISVTCGEASFAVASLPSAEYPELPELPQLAGTADGGALATAIGQVTPAASRDDTLPMLTAVNVELAGETMTLAATDRYRLAVRELGWNPAPGFGDAGRVSLLVPARTLSDAAKMMSAGTEVAIMLRPDGDRAGGASAAGAGRGGRGHDRLRRGRAAADRAAAGRGVRPVPVALPRRVRLHRRPPGRGVRGGRAAGRAGRRARHPGAAHVRARTGHGRGGDAGPGAGQGVGAGRLRRRRAGDRLQPALPAGRRHRGDRHPAGHARRGGRVRPPARRLRRHAGPAERGTGRGRVQALVHQPEQARRDHPPARTRTRTSTKGAEADFRYLVVPQRVQLSACACAPGRQRGTQRPAATGRAGSSGRPRERRAGRTAER